VKTTLQKKIQKKTHEFVEEARLLKSNNGKEKVEQKCIPSC